MKLQRLEVALSGESIAHVGAVYAFSALVHQISTHIPILPFEEFAIIDSSRPDLQMTGTKTLLHLHLAPTNVSSPFIAVPRWILYCPPQITSLQMSRVVVDVDVMRGLYHTIPVLQYMSFRDSVIDLKVKSKRALTWGFLWHTAKQNGCHLRLIDVSFCAYLGSPDGPHAPAVQLNLLMKADAELLMHLHHHLWSRAHSKSLSSD
jgi:hypothetical protein